MPSVTSTTDAACAPPSPSPGGSGRRLPRKPASSGHRGGGVGDPPSRAARSRMDQSAVTSVGRLPAAGETGLFVRAEEGASCAGGGGGMRIVVQIAMSPVRPGARSRARSRRPMSRRCCGVPAYLDLGRRDRRGPTLVLRVLRAAPARAPAAAAAAFDGRKPATIHSSAHAADGDAVRITALHRRACYRRQCWPASSSAPFTQQPPVPSRRDSVRATRARLHAPPTPCSPEEARRDGIARGLRRLRPPP